MPELLNSILSNDPESRERRLMDFIELSSDWFWEMGPDFRFTSISSGYQEIIGLNPSHMIGRTRWELAAGNSNDAFWRAHRATHEAHLPYRDFVYQIATDGNDRGWRRVSGKPIWGANREFLGYRGTARDITDAMRAEQAAQKSEQRLIDAVNAMSEGFALFDSEDRLVLCNDHYLKIYSYLNDIPDLLGRTFEDIIRQGLERGYIGDEEALAAPEEWVKTRVAQHRSPSGVPLEQRLTDGRWLRIYEKPTSEGGIVGVRTDITDLKRAEQMLLDAIESSDSGLALFNPKDRLILCNSAYRRIWAQYADRLLPGISFREMCELSWDFGLVVDQEADRDAWVERRVKEHLAGDKVVDRQLANHRWIRVIERRTESGGVVSILSDISELKRQRAEIESFAYSVTHDLHAPLRAVLSFAEALKEDYGEKLGPDGAEFLEDIIGGAGRMAELLRDLLNYAKLGGRTAPPRRLDLKVLVTEVTGLWNDKTVEREPVFRIQGNAPPVKGDRSVLLQVIQNLLDNAVKFVPEDRTPLITVTLGHSGEFAFLKVEDNGIGIKKEFQSRIFEMFKRLHAENEYDGTGIGLSIVKKGAEMHGGHAEVLSHLGEGSTFSVFLPITGPEAGAAHERH